MRRWRLRAALCCSGGRREAKLHRWQLRVAPTLALALTLSLTLTLTLTLTRTLTLTLNNPNPNQPYP